MIIMKTVIGIPAFNEEENIAKIITKLKKLSYSIIVCNDGSSDMTGEIAEEMGVIVINHPKNLGYGSAIRSIFTKASELNFDILVTFDSDGQHKTSDIKSVLKPIINQQADIVIGSRFSNDDSNEVPTYRKIGIKAITALANSTSDNKISDSQSGFRAYNKKILNQIIPSDTGMGVSTEILIKANSQNFNIIEVPITVSYQGDTSTHNPTSHGVSVIMSTMKFISIEHPLKFYGVPGFVFLMIGLFFVVWTIQEFTISRQIITNISLIGIGSIILGTILSMTSIMLYSLVNVVRERNNN
jgi:glycosyltransferase involved in cell wall biosynthesis